MGKSAVRTIALAVSAFFTFAFVAVYSFDVQWLFLLKALGVCLLALMILALPAALIGWVITKIRGN